MSRENTITIPDKYKDRLRKARAAATEARTLIEECYDEMKLDEEQESIDLEQDFYDNDCSPALEQWLDSMNLGDSQ